jgi:ABC-type transport system involved in multi-copper enzyme maturation permease subunit
MNLLWKEYRESLPVVLLALGVILVLALQPALAGHPREYGLIWGFGFQSGALAILVFVSLVLGVTAYAVEEEQDTLVPLTAKPVPADDIMASKIGARFGLIFVALLLFGVLQLITGAWPIEWDIPTPWAFQRWLGSIASCLAGFGLGLYFGRTQGQQTSALLVSALIIGAGFVVINFTPVKFLFENAEGPNRAYWVREILIPGIVGLGAVLAAIRLPAERRRLLPAGVLPVVSLVFYGLIVWSLTLLPFNSVWSSPEAYRDYWTMRFGDPFDALKTVADRTQDPDYAEEKGIDRALAQLDRVWSITPRVRSISGYRYDTLLGSVPYTTGNPRDTRPFGTLNSTESYFISQCRPEDLDLLLETSTKGELKEFERFMLLHIVGVMDDDRHTEAIAAQLEDPSLTVRGFAALLLVARGDDRGRSTLEGGLEAFPYPVIALATRMEYNEDFTVAPAIGDLMREWIRIPPEVMDREALGIPVYRGADGKPYPLAHLRNLAQSWIFRRGEIEDLPLLRYSVWAEGSTRQRNETRLEDIELLKYYQWSDEYLLNWSEPDLPGRIRRLVRELGPELDRYRTYLQGRGYRNVRLRQLYRDYDGALNLLHRLVRAAFKTHNAQALDLWRETKDLLILYRSRYSYLGLDLLPMMVEQGAAGIAELRTLMNRPKESPYIRFQAALLLTRQGEPGAAEQALWLWDLYRSSGDYIWWSYALQAFRQLAREGHRSFVGPILQVANESLQNPDANLYWYRDIWDEGMGAGFWNQGIARLLRDVSGEDYGWDLKAWTEWWEREKVR